jgi:catechol 2,3-dioxygenase-like lactoylglutathione lyase family enzyme
VKKRTGDPWIPAPAYGALLPQFTVNLIVRDINAALEFYRTVLQAQVHYADPDFAAVRILGIELMLHADHAYDHSPWTVAFEGGQPRGLGAELRLLGMNPDELAARARAVNALFRDVSVRGHGWREVMVRDPDGYVWAVGETVGSNG